MEKLSGFNTNDEPIELPPGFRFHPSDEELITHYLSHKVVDGSFSTKAVGEVDLNKVEPWDLPWKAKMGEKEWYFFCVRDRKYPTGSRTNRATEAGYWKATGKDREIFRAKLLVGMKKTLVFYRGRAPKGEKTNWVMHEFRLEGKISMRNLPPNAKNEWVICRVFKKTTGGKKVHITGLVSSGDDSQSSDLPPLMDLSSDIENRVTPPAEVCHQTLLYNQMENNNEFSSSSKNCNLSPFPYSSPPNPVFSNQSIPLTESSNLRGSFMMQDQSVLRLLLDGNVSNMAQNAKAEVMESMSYDHELGFKGYDAHDFPIVSTAPIDLDCLWNY